MKNTRVIIFILFAMFLFASCQSIKQEYGVTSSQIERDLQQLEAVNNGIISGVYISESDYDLVEYEITKRQTNSEKKEDIIYCTVTITNQCVESQIEYKLVYNYYDQGGWILDESSIIDDFSKPLVGVDISYIQNFRVSYDEMVNYNEISNVLYVHNAYSDTEPYLLSKFTFSDCVTDLENGSDLLYFTYSDLNYQLTGTVQFEFDQNYGWIQSCYTSSPEDEDGIVQLKITKVDIDWESALSGNFKNKKASESITLKDFSRSDGSVSVDYLYDIASSSQEIYANNVIASVNYYSFSIKFIATNYYPFSYDGEPYHDKEINLFYNFRTDSWHGGSKYIWGYLDRI